MKCAPLVACLVGAVLLTGCTSAALDEPLVHSDVDPASAPGFLDEPQGDEDVISEIDVGVFGVSADSTRYQGEWQGLDIFLGVAGEAGVNIISGVDGIDSGWGAGSSGGNSVIGFGPFETEDPNSPVSLQYLPQGTEDAPDGWRALSDWIIVRDS